MRQILFALLIASVVMPVNFTAAIAQSTTERVCIIKSMVGSVQIRKGASPQWRDARINMPLSEKDAIRTFVESEAQLETSEGSIIKMSENSTMEVSRFRGNATGEQSTKIKILTGNLFSNVKKIASSKSDFSFETPTATASIRGTQLGIEVNNQATAVKVYEGIVMVVPAGSSSGSEVKANEMTTVKKGQRTVSIEKLTEKAPVVETGSIAPVDSAKKDSTAVAKADTIKPVPKELILTVTQPAEGQKLDQPSIPVNGTVTPGASVSASGIMIPVTATGSFSGKIPIPDEETSMSVQIEASLESKTKSVTRTISYAPAVKLSVNTPAERATITTTSITVSGTVTPKGAEVQVNGKPASVIASTGQFSATVTVADVEDEYQIEITASSGGKSMSMTRSIIYKRAMDINKPALQPTSLPTIAKQNRLTFSAIDRTPDEEITFYREIDGSTESETGVPNQQFYLTIEEGVHTYAVYADDKGKNRTQRLSGTIKFLVRQCAIRMGKPSGSTEYLNLPPNAPDDAFAPSYNVRFTVTNLPDDNPKLLSEVSVTNSATGKVVSKRDPTSIDFEFDVDIDRTKVNTLTIMVRDINDRIIQNQATIRVR